LIFSFKKILNETNDTNETNATTANETEELLLITRETVMVFDVSSEPENPWILGVFGSEMDLSLLESEDVKVLEPRFKDIELGGRRYQVMPFAPR
jgi:hypothetical protein